MTSGNIVFIGSTTSTAAIETDGGFTFKSASGDGLPEGEYRVRIEVAGTIGSGGKAKAALPFASHYLDEDVSGLSATVTPDESKNNFEFKLEAKDSTKSAKSPRTIGGK